MYEISAERQQIVEVATDLIGKACIRYVADRPDLGQSPVEGFDCSGLARYVLDEAGLSVPDYIAQDNTVRPVRHTNEFFDHYGILVHAAYVQPGDLIFFSREGWTPSHMGIMVDDGQYVHAPGQDGLSVVIESVKQVSIEPRARNNHRLLYDSNPIGYKSPTMEHEDKSYRVHQRAVL
jgi:cell wall-associated NlpC family hydrolase